MHLGHLWVMGLAADFQEAALGGLAEGALPFSPFKTAFFIGWFYLCLYSVQRSDSSPLVQNRYRYVSNLAALIIGPLHLWVLFIADTVRKVQDGELTVRQVPSYLLDAVMDKPLRRRKEASVKAPAIQLMDTAGRRFDELYAKQIRSEGKDRHVQENTEQIVLAGINERATDILIDPKSDSEYTIRFRVDGFLRIHQTVDSKLCNAMVNSLKAVAGMDIAEKRRPQDGAFMARIPEGEIYFRMATSGVLGGEKLAIRVLDQTRAPMGLEDIGFAAEQVKTLNRIIQQPQGMVIVCGPTGSGKTTTLYAMLQTVNFQERNVITIEDPIEHVMPHISQIEINTKAGVTFATSLRSILRQDPDVICVGEIRDAETAGMAIQAAQTGHLVLATLHASSNMAAIVRLMDLQVKPLLISSALSVIISQRLIRCLCDYCKGPAELTQSQMDYCRQNNLNHQNIFKPNGCGHCGGTGFYGRTAIIDVMYMNDRIGKLLCNNQLTPGDMKQQGDRSFVDALKREGMQRVMAGRTTLSEVKRVTASLG